VNVASLNSGSILHFWLRQLEISHKTSDKIMSRERALINILMNGFPSGIPNSSKGHRDPD
jgi:hypothetical protein